MAVASEILKLTFADIVANVPISVDIQTYSVAHVIVRYGNAGITASLSTDYTCTLNFVDYRTVTITPKTALINKINALIASNPAEDNFIVVERHVPLTTDFTESDAFARRKIANEIDLMAMRIMQLHEGMSTILTPIEDLQSLVAQAALSAASAASSYTSFLTTYYGPLASNPTYNPVGGAVKHGDLYLNTTTGVLRYYTGSAWVDVVAAAPAPDLTGAVLYNAIQSLTVSQARQALTNMKSPLSSLSLELFGGSGNGVTDNTAALTACYNAQLAARGREGVSIRTFGGVYLFNSGVSLTFPTGALAPGFSLSLLGDGSAVTKFLFPNGGGITMTQGDYRQACHVHGIQFMTGQAGGSNGLTLMGFAVALPNTPWTTFDDLYFTGDELNGYGYTSHYWAVSIFCKKWHQINATKVNTYGAYGAPNTAGFGVGMSIQGDSATGEYAVLFNFSQCSFNYHVVGFSYYEYIQGVTFDQCNFNGATGNCGIQVAGTGVQAQLAITNSQFNCGGNQIAALVAIDQLLLTNNIFTVCQNGAAGIYAPASFLSHVVNNSFNCMFGGLTATTAGVFGAPGQGIIAGNIVSGYSLGFNLLTGTSDIKLYGNSYPGTPTPYVNSGGAGNSIGSPGA